MLISDGALGAAMAKALGEKPVVLMRGHGSTVVGASIEQVVYRAIYAEVNARLQIEATQLGPVTYLNAQEARMAAATNDTVVSRPWELWVREVGPID
jgi:HCOMODA/2-hydroxy-3-carboxy-muconic semialdehyde decarboxylase